MQQTHVVTLTLVLPATQAQALARWIQALTIDDYFACTLNRQHAFDVMCAARFILDELIASGTVR